MATFMRFRNLVSEMRKEINGQSDIFINKNNQITNEVEEFMKESFTFLFEQEELRIEGCMYGI